MEGGKEIERPYRREGRVVPPFREKGERKPIAKSVGEKTLTAQ